MENENVKTSKSKLLMKASSILFLILLFVCSALFLSAGSLKFWNAWILIGEFFLLEFIFIIYLAIKEPELLQKRTIFKEKEKTQRTFNILVWTLAIITILIIPGLDFRYHLSHVPVWLVLVASTIMLSGFIMVVIVMKQNIYTSRTVEIKEGQKLIDSGLYSIVRHPMYLFGLIVICSMPLILGSMYSFILLIIFCPLLFIIRILNEEKVLKDNLDGYKEYMKEVKYRLIPYVW
jgi:protein-S-isoprenylcysteine O-methyltransferase Ste14